MRYRISMLIVAAATCLGGGSACGESLSSGGFGNPQTFGGSGELTGTLRDTEGEPVAETTIFLRRDGKNRQSTVSDGMGRFTFDSSPAGPIQLAANDGSGRGAVAETTVYAGGTNRAGVLEVGAMEDRPELLDVHGIGLEERLTTAEGDLEYPVYSPDRERVYGARKRDGRSTYRVVEIETSTGDEEVLLEDQTLYNIDGRELLATSGEVFALVADRYLLFSRGGEESGHVIYDVREREFVFESSDVPGQPTELNTPEVTPSAILLPHTTETREIDGGQKSHAEKSRIHVFDVADGVVEEGPRPGYTWSRGFTFVASNSRVALIRSFAACTDGSSEEFVNCRRHGAGPARPSGFFAIDLESLKVSTIDKHGPFDDVRPKLAETGAVAYEVHPGGDGEPPGTVVFRHDLEAETTDRHLIRSCSGCTVPRLLAGPDEVSLYVRWETGRPEGTQLVHWNLDSDGKERIPTEIEVDGSELNLCKASQCEVDRLPDGRLRMRQVFRRSEGDWWAAMLDYRGAERVERRLIDLWEEGREAGDFDPDVWRAPDAEVEAMRLRRDDSGFLQLFVRRGPTSPESPAFGRRTYLPSHHRHPVLSRDGTTLWYVTRAPSSGYSQLFRVQLDRFAAATRSPDDSDDPDE